MANQTISARDLMGFGLGMLVGAAAARIAPPIAMRTAGTLAGRAGRDPFEMLALDHRLVLGLIERMLRTEPAARLRRAAMTVQLKRMLTAHALAEEDVIYPMLREDAQRAETASRLYREHAEMKIHLFELEHLAKDDPRWLDRLKELRGIVAEHARQEEESEFPALRAALDDNNQARLLGEIGREKAMVL